MRKTGLLLSLVVFCFGVAPANAQQKEMTIDQAYKAIPHVRTQYDPKQSTLPDAEKAYLDHLFFVTDLALQKRMMMLHYFSKTREEAYLKTYNTEIGNMISTFSLMPAPTEQLKSVEQTLITALRQQQKFFNDWAASKGTGQYERLQKNHTSELLVISSHNNLISVYNMLNQLYPQETEHNKKAFYDHLCALDFI